MLNMDPSNQSKLILTLFQKGVTKDKKTKVKGIAETIIGECFIKISDLQLMTLQDMILPIINENGKQKGFFKLKNCTVRNFYTYLDLYVTNELKLVPVIAVDYSLANLTFDESCYCLHTLK
jgi:Copine